MNALDPVTLETRCDDGDRVGIGWVTAMSAAREAVERMRDNPCPATWNALDVALAGLDRQTSRALEVVDELKRLRRAEWADVPGVEW